MDVVVALVYVLVSQNNQVYTHIVHNIIFKQLVINMISTNLILRGSTTAKFSGNYTHQFL